VFGALGYDIAFWFEAVRALWSTRLATNKKAVAREASRPNPSQLRRIPSFGANEKIGAIPVARERAISEDK
jgi:hypothetical protein